MSLFSCLVKTLEMLRRSKLTAPQMKEALTSACIASIFNWFFPSLIEAIRMENVVQSPAVSRRCFNAPVCDGPISVSNFFRLFTSYVASIRVGSFQCRVEQLSGLWCCPCCRWHAQMRRKIIMAKLNAKKVPLLSLSIQSRSENSSLFQQNC